MSKSFLKNLLFLAAFIVTLNEVNAQCKPQEKGKNLVQNSGFELGDTLFTAGSYYSWNKNGLQGWSSAGQYWVGNSPNRFNHQGFELAALAHKGNNMMLVDADCDAGKTVWEQVVYVYPNTNYYFSLWIQSLKDVSPAKLSFEVDGVTLGKLVDAPSTPGVWKFYEDVWNSGTLEGEVHLIIKERSGINCGSGDDFAIDDISFIPGCEYGAPGPITDLGPDVSICGSGGKLTLNSGVPAQKNVTFLWNTGEITPTIDVTAPGIYYVCVDSVSACPRSDVIEVLADYTIGLQSDVDLCNPASVTLDPGYSAPGVKYKWYKDGKVINGQKDQQLLVNSPGTYVVEVNEPICGIRTDEIKVTSSAALAGNAEFCPPAMPSLSITGPGNYAWFDSPDLTNKVAVGATYDPTGLTQTTTYYVKDTTSFVKRVGQPTKLSTNYGVGGQYDQGFEVTVINDLLLDSVTVYPVSWNAGNGNVGITVYDVTGGGKVQVGQVIQSISLPNNGGNPTEADKRQVKVGLQLIGGKKYVITAEGSSAQFSFHQSGEQPAYPYSIPGFISINKLVNQYSQVYGVFYDWVVVVGSPCKPVPVIASLFCPPNCTMPDAVKLSAPDLCGGTKVLKAILDNPTPGYTSYKYEFFKDGFSQQFSAVDSLTVSDIGVYTVVLTDTGAKNPSICTLASAPFTVKNSAIGDATKPTGPSPICEGINETYTVAPVTNADSYTWGIVADASIVGPANGNTVDVKFGKTSGFVKVTPWNAACGFGKADSVEVTVNLLPDSAKAISGPVAACKGETQTYTINAVANATSYTWSVPTGSTIVGAADGLSIDVEIGTGKGFVKVTPVNDCGSGASDSLAVNYSAKPVKAELTIAPPTACEGDTVAYTINVVDNVDGYSWSVPADAAILGKVDTTTIKVKFGKTTDYVIVTPLNAQCGDGEADSVLVNVTKLPEDATVPVSDSLTGCKGENHTYSIPAVANATSYIWSVPAGSTIVGPADGLSIEVQAGSTGGFVKVTPINGCGIGKADSVEVIFSDKPAKTAILNPASEVCLGDTLTFSVNTVEFADKYSWNVPSNAVIISSNTDSTSIKVKFGATAGTVTITPKNTLCGAGLSDAVSVDVNLPPADAGAVVVTSTSCQSDIVSYYLLSPVDRATSYEWSLPLGAELVESFGDSIRVKLGESSGFVSVKPINDCGEGAASPAQSVKVIPSVSPYIATSATEVLCAGVEGTFIADTSNGGKTPTLEWFVNGVAQGVDNKVFKSSNLKGGDSLIVTMTASSELCVNYTTAADTVVIPKIGAAISNDTTACFPESVMLIAGGGATYQWYTASESDLSTNDTIIVSKSGVYFVDVKVDKCSETLKREVVIYHPTVVVDPAVSSINLGASVTINAAATGDGPFQYSWTNEGNTELTKDSTVTVTPILKSGGLAKFYIQVQDVHGCNTNDSALVNVIKVPLYIPNLITPNNDGQNDVFMVKGITPGTKVVIFNRWGHQVYASDNYDNSWGAENVSDGVYYVHINLGITNEEYKGWLQVMSKKD